MFLAVWTFISLAVTTIIYAWLAQGGAVSGLIFFGVMLIGVVTNMVLGPEPRPAAPCSSPVAWPGPPGRPAPAPLRLTRRPPAAVPLRLPIPLRKTSHQPTSRHRSTSSSSAAPNASR